MGGGEWTAFNLINISNIYRFFLLFLLCNICQQFLFTILFLLLCKIKVFNINWLINEIIIHSVIFYDGRIISTRSRRRITKISFQYSCIAKSFICMKFHHDSKRKQTFISIIFYFEKCPFTKIPEMIIDSPKALLGFDFFEKNSTFFHAKKNSSCFQSMKSEKDRSINFDYYDFLDRS